MYKEITKEDLKERLKLPTDYKVDACFIYGGWNEANRRGFLKTLEKRNYKIEKLSYKFLKPITSVLVGKKRIWFMMEYGGARLSEYIHFASMLGSRKNIVVGTCGALKKGMDTLSVLVPTFSHSTESSCRMYDKNNKDCIFLPDKKLTKNLIAKLENKLNVYHGPMVTCQGMMGETWEDILEWSRQGFYGVEMECSTVFSVSKHFKVPSAGVLIIADNLIEKETVESKSYNSRRRKIKEIKKEVFKIVSDMVLE